MSHQFNKPGHRGDTEVSGVTFRYLYKLVRDRCEYFQGDPDAAAQQFCVLLEQKMGIFPNITPLSTRGAKP